MVLVLSHNHQYILAAFEFGGFLLFRQYRQNKVTGKYKYFKGRGSAKKSCKRCHSYFITQYNLYANYVKVR